MKTLLTSLVLAVVLVPTVANASFTCKDIGRDEKFPKIRTFYQCRNLDDIKTSSKDLQEYWKGSY